MIADETEAAKEVIHSQRIEIASRTNPLCYTVASFFIFQQLNMSSEHIHIHPIVVGADGHSRIDCNSNSKREAKKTHSRTRTTEREYIIIMVVCKMRRNGKSKREQKWYIYFFRLYLQWACVCAMCSMCHSVGNSWFAERPFVRFGDYVHQSQVQILQPIWMFCSFSIYLFIISSFGFFFLFYFSLLIFFSGHPTVKLQWYRSGSLLFPKNKNKTKKVVFQFVSVVAYVNCAYESIESSEFSRHKCIHFFCSSWVRLA